MKWHAWVGQRFFPKCGKIALQSRRPHIRFICCKAPGCAVYLCKRVEDAKKSRMQPPQGYNIAVVGGSGGRQVGRSLDALMSV